MKKLTFFIVSLPLVAQNYANYNNQPIARISFLRHQVFQSSGNVLGDSTLIGWWPLLEGTGNVGYDASGNHRNAAWAGSQNGSKGFYSAGKSASWAGVFNGSTNYLSSSTVSVSGNISVTVWVFSSNFNQQGMILEKDPVNTQWELFFEQPNALRWRGGGLSAVSCSIPTNSAWHFLAATQSGATANVYIDGSLCSTGSSTAIANGTGALNIGRFASSYFFSGLLSDVRLYNRALSQPEIQAIFRAENH